MQRNHNIIPTAVIVIIINYYYNITCLVLFGGATADASCSRTHAVLQAEQTEHTARRNRVTYLPTNPMTKIYKVTNTRADGTFCGTVTPLELDRLYFFFL